MNRLIDVPSERETPEELLSDLRRINPAVELYYAGEGEWWVGEVKPNSERRRRGRIMAARALAAQNWPAWRMGLLMAQGFGLVCKMTLHGYPDSRLVHEYRRKDWHWRQWRAQQEIEEQVLAATEKTRNKEAAARLREDYLATEGRHIFKRYVRGNVSVSMSH
jgi:hypothetical protein